ncbi:MAG: hypothetical protein AUK47_22890 [Deltaproteobacteria bacterium CG2_30_63_29]|nr:MAG: hypothetical protein AUK47_22890 [Deltaproteobacteria bacterium CG2_30_63_29]PJB37016.1 MAG: hypothetical protein CO108_22025 [Deltaproteobacteria bacterium CG_4_9_14_3_um_filter_63_12]
MWTPQHQWLLDALDAQTTLPTLSQALRLPQGESTRANLDLLRAFEAEAVHHSPTRAALRALLDGDGAPLAALADARFPDALSPRLVHHLALAWGRSDDERLAARSLEGLLTLWESHRDYLRAVATASSGEAVSSEVLEKWPKSLVAESLEAIRRAATPDADLDEVYKERIRLESVVRGLRKNGRQSEVATDIERASQDAVADGVRALVLSCGEHSRAAETALSNGDGSLLPDAFGPAVRFAAAVGHSEALTLWVLDTATAMAWPPHQDGLHGRVLELLGPLTPFADDLAARLARDEVFGHQALYADFQVLYGTALPKSGATWNETLRCLENRNRALRNGSERCSTHRNARVVLASTNLDLADHLLCAVGIQPGFPWRKQAHTIAVVKRVRTLVGEAEALRPEHPSLPELKSRLELVEAKLALLGAKT